MADTRPVLILDDNLLFSSGLVAAIRRLSLPVIVVDAGDRVLSRARDVAPQAILVNLASRSIGSADRVRELKADPELGTIPVVGYCGHLESALIEAGRAAGCDVVVANSAISARPDDVLLRAGVTLPQTGV